MLGLRVATTLAVLSITVPAMGAEPQAFINIDGVAAPDARARADQPGHPAIERLLTGPGDLLERVRRGFAMPDLVHERVAVHERWYAARPQLVKAIFERARPYLHFILDEVERRGLPSELALLPVIESGFNPTALSSAEASGLWQFVPATGARYGLAQSAHFDTRRDVVASTGAALEYLGALYRLHGDWHLALASYNWGETAVLGSMQRTRARGQTPSFSMLRLPQETSHYVPRLQAVKNIVADPQRFGLALPRLPNEPFFAVVTIDAAVPLARAAQLAAITVEEVLLLNPAWIQPFGEKASTRRLLLPVDRVDGFRASLEKWKDEGGRSEVSRKARKGSRQR